MLKWEYYKRFKERFQKISFLNDLSFKVVFLLFVLLKIIEGSALFFVGRELVDKKYGVLLIVGMVIVYFLIELRSQQGKIKTLIQNERIIDFYKVNSKYTERQIIIRLVFSEILWNISDIVGLYGPIIFLLSFSDGFNILRLIFGIIAIVLIYIINTISLYYYCNKLYKKRNENNVFQVIYKGILFGACLWIGSCISDFVLTCPLQMKQNAIKAFKDWFAKFNDIKFAFSTNNIKLFCILIIFALILFVGGKYLKKSTENIFSRDLGKKTFNKYILYESDNLTVRDFGIFTILFMGLFMGILYEKGCSASNMSILIGVLMVNYTICWMIDDVLSFHDELSLDYDGKKLYMWKDKIDEILKYKLNIFLKNYVLKIVLLYLAAYLLTISSIKDIIYCIYNLILLTLFLFIGFIRRNLAIANSPQKVRDEYEEVKYTGERVLESNISGGEIMIVAIISAIPSILFACEEISFCMFWVMQILLIFALVIYVYVNYKMLIKTIMSPKWIMKLFDEEKNSGVIED